MTAGRLIKSVLCAAAFFTAGEAAGQSVYLRTPDAEAAAEEAEHPGEARAEASTIATPPPEPRVFGKHDIVHIVVSEATKVKSEHDLSTEKDGEMGAEVTAFPELLEFLELRFKAGDETAGELPKLGVKADRAYDAAGEYERKDTFTARIAATILEVKPNGTLVLEARQRIETDGEVQLMVLSGSCREEDVTAASTVFSYQLADLRIVRETEGELKQNAQKGFFTKVLETIFSF
ncbi:MAG: flagellar basal body L-ring protein FlgH [Phycisphaerales bacterium]|nr:flagellar basal body L-ring protein FlgH [Phycisphaerales bacterium]